MRPEKSFSLADMEWKPLDYRKDSRKMSFKILAKNKEMRKGGLKKKLEKHLAAMKFPISFNDETFIIVQRESFSRQFV